MTLHHPDWKLCESPSKDSRKGLLFKFCPVVDHHPWNIGPSGYLVPRYYSDAILLCTGNYYRRSPTNTIVEEFYDINQAGLVLFAYEHSRKIPQMRDG